MSSRRALDAYYTETAVTKILLDAVPHIGGYIAEPCSGSGQMALVLDSHPNTLTVITNDINDSVATPAEFHDDAGDPQAGVYSSPVDWVVTNPPFGAAERILPVAARSARVGMACLLRLSYAEPTKGRARWLASNADQMTHLIVINPRPSFTGDGKTDSTTVAWFVWQWAWSWHECGIPCPFQFAAGWR